MDDIMSQLNSVDFSTVETDFPILKPGVVNATIVECVPDQDAADKPPYLKVVYNLAQDWETQPLDGRPSKPVAAGFPITERIYVQPWTDPKTGEVKNFGITRIALLREAVFGKAAPGTTFNAAELVGQTITLKLSFDAAPKNKKTGEVYGPQTSVHSYVRRKQ